MHKQEGGPPGALPGLGLRRAMVAGRLACMPSMVMVMVNVVLVAAALRQRRPPVAVWLWEALAQCVCHYQCLPVRA